MSARPRAAATRQELLGLRRRLERVQKGAALLRRKREALVVELFRLARPAAAARASITEQAARAYPALLEALAESGYDGVRALGWPGRELAVEVRPAQVWGIPVSEILRRTTVRRTLEARGTSPSGAPASVTQAATAFEDLVELLLDAAAREAVLRRLGEALARTSRQVNTLEHRVGPTLDLQQRTVRRVLDEREREEHLRLGRVLRRGAAS